MTVRSLESMPSMSPLNGQAPSPGLRVSSPIDRSEIEAEAMADRVLAMPDPTSAPLGVQRSCDGGYGCGGSCGDEITRQPVDEVQRQPEEEEEEEELQLSPDGGGARPGSVSAGAVRGLGSGSPLPSSTRRFFESRFGTDLSGVRLHTDATAGQLARNVGAKAFTCHQSIAFAPGQYRPNTNSGRRLLAHELTHTIQQRRGFETGHVHRLGANPGCSAAETRTIHQAIYNARGWVDKALPKLEASPPAASTLRVLRRNFGPTYGVAANLAMIARRVRVARREVSTIAFSCQGATGTCAGTPPPCGFATAGGHAATICRIPTLDATRHWIFQAGCVLHESLHSAFTNFTVDEYSGWHGHSGSDATYPGTGPDPLLNADSYTKLVMDLS